MADDPRKRLLDQIRNLDLAEQRRRELQGLRPKAPTNLLMPTAASGHDAPDDTPSNSLLANHSPSTASGCQDPAALGTYRPTPSPDKWGRGGHS